MRVMQFGACFVTCSLIAVQMFAQDSGATLPSELGWLKFRISAGRLQVASPQYRESRSYESGNPLAGTSETLRLNVSSRTASVNYKRTTPERVTMVEFDSPNSVTIEMLPGDENSGDFAAVKYTQPTDGAVQLVIDDGRQTRTHRGASFWHLMLLSPTDVQEHLLPVLAMLRPGWPIEETAQEIESSIIEIANSPHRPDRKRWEQLIEQLGSPSFQQRRTAERLLREAGPAVVTFLNSLSPDSLDAERRARVDRLLSSLSSSADDTPDRIAMWLIDDPLIWTVVLESEKASNRALAKTELEKILGQAVEFDTEGEPAKRRVQVEAIRQSLSH